MLELYDPLINFLIGFFLLLFGQQFFWIFSVIIAFLYGFNLTEIFLPDLSLKTMIISGIICGFLGGVIGVTFRPFAIFVISILSGGFIGMHIYPAFLYNIEIIYLPSVIIGTLIAVLLFTLSFDWALIILSSFIGTMFVFAPLYEGANSQIIGFIALFISGVALQSILIEKERTIL